MALKRVMCVPSGFRRVTVGTEHPPVYPLQRVVWFIRTCDASTSGIVSGSGKPAWPADRQGRPVVGGNSMRLGDRRKWFVVLLLQVWFAASTAGAAPEPVLLYPQGAPGAVGKESADVPTITVYPAPNTPPGG